MVTIEAGKSSRWHSNHCCICGKLLNKAAKKISGTATLLDDTEIRVIYCEDPCAKQAKIRQDAENAARALAGKEGKPENNMENGMVMIG